MEIRKALVVGNIDPDKKGKIKVRVLPEMKDVNDESKLRWIYPFLTNGQEHNVPEIDSYVTVIIKDPSWLFIEYLPMDYTEDNYPYADFTDNLSNIPDLASQTYPQPLYIKEFADGSFMFHNSDTGEHGVYNSNGSYMVFDVNGDIFVYSNDKTKVYDKAGNKVNMSSTGIVVEDKSTNKVEMLSAGITITDKSGNKIAMSSTGVNINSGKLTVAL